MSIDYYNPTFQAFPYNNNRTAWRPIGFPVIMVVPLRRDVVGSPVANSQVFNVKVLIENVPREARVAGHDHIGMRYPDKELYAETLDSLELADRLVDLANVDYYRDDIEIDAADAKTGDTIHYTTRTGIRGTIEYITGANYYDLSDVTIEVETLPSDDYNLVYEAQYFTRVVSNDGSGDLLCIDASSISLAILRIPIQHPGQIIDEFHRLTPPPYLTNTAKSDDTTLWLYRPITDILQDIADEQKLLQTINFVFNTPAEAIPYLSQLLGWELPYFPQSLDNLRKAVLRRTVEFQNIKGSHRAIVNIFRLFGFEILISNLWWSSDGQRLIRPDENLPLQYQDQEITTRESCQIDAILSGWSEQKFAEYEIPLLYRPQEKATIDDFTSLRDGGSITLDAYLVDIDSDAYEELVSISTDIQNDPRDYGDTSGATIDENGYMNPTDIHTRMSGLTVVGYSQVLISGKLGAATSELSAGTLVPIHDSNVSFNRDTNVLSVTLNGMIDDTQAIFIFATYTKQELVVPDVLANLQSNRFDITVVTEDLLEFADPIVLDFAIEFLYKLKAFHSLLNVIRQRIDFTESYEVTDFCVGGDMVQRYDTDAGMLQVPPAIIPEVPGVINDCTQLDPVTLGYKDADILLRTRKLTSLTDELAAWSIFDSRETASGDTRLAPLEPVPGREAFFYTLYGQDRILPGYTNTWSTEYNPGPNANQGDIPVDLSPQDTSNDGVFETTGAETVTNSDSSAYGSFMREYREIPTGWPELDDKTDYCYKGRVDDELLYRPTFVGSESIHCHPCHLGLGTGVYYTYPSISQKLSPGNRNRQYGSMSRKLRFSGSAPEESLKYYLGNVQSEYLTRDYDTPLSPKQNSLLGRLYSGFDQPTNQTLHYTNRYSANTDQQHQLALLRPSLDIEKPNLFLPGCRFLRMNALQADFIHPTYRARPWDDKYSTFCGPYNICGTTDPTMLNVTKTVDINGDEWLVFDDVPYTVDGNNLIPDIPSLDDHTLPTDALFEASDVIHKIWSFASDNHPWIVFDQLCDSVEFQLVHVDEPIFSSNYPCTTTGYIDFADGYPCVSGYQPYDDIPDLGRDGLYQDIIDGLEVPTRTTYMPDNYLMMLCSGILVETSMRLDCGCLLVHCGGTTNESTICSIDDYRDQDGDLDVRCDQLWVDAVLKPEETIGTCSIRLDGTIPSLLEILET